MGLHFNAAQFVLHCNTPLSELETHMPASAPPAVRCSVLEFDIGISISYSIFVSCQHTGPPSQSPDPFTYSSAMSFMRGNRTGGKRHRLDAVGGNVKPHVSKCSATTVVAARMKQTTQCISMYYKW